MPSVLQDEANLMPPDEPNRNHASGGARASGTVARQPSVYDYLPGTAVLVFSRDLWHLTAAGTALTSCGLSPLGIVGRPMADALPAWLLGRLQPLYHAALAGVRSRAEFTCDDLTFEVRVVPVASPHASRSPQAPAGVAVWHDITAHHRVREALRESEESFRALANNARDAILIGLADGRHVYANARAAEMLEYSVNELLRTTVTDICPPDIAPKLMRNLQRRLVGDDFNSRYETFLQSRSGRRIPVELAAARTTWHGRLADLVILRDIAERKAIERKLRLQAQLIDSVRESVVATDLDGRITFWSQGAERLYGYLAQEVEGHRLTFTVPADDRVTEEARLRCVRETGSWSGEYEQRRKDGSTFWASTCISLVLDEQGQPAGFIGIDRDITDRRRAEERIRSQQAELAHAQRVSTMGELATSLAHELNQPLCAVLGCSELCQRLLRVHADIPPQVRDALGEIVRQAERAAQIVRRTRTFVKKRPPEQRLVDLNDLVTEAIELTRGEMTEHAVTLETRLHAAPLPVHADSVQVQQVVVNLLHNAIDALDQSPSGARHLQVRTAADHQQQALVHIRDTGPGLTPETAEQLFQPFFTRKPHGLGLGLSISRSIIEAHAGHIWAESQPGHGATFSFALPRQEES